MLILCALQKPPSGYTGAVIYKQRSRVRTCMERTERSKPGVFRRTGEENALRVRNYSSDAQALLRVRGKKGKAMKRVSLADFCGNLLLPTYSLKVWSCSHTPILCMLTETPKILKNPKMEI